MLIVDKIEVSAQAKFERICEKNNNDSRFDEQGGMKIHLHGFFLIFIIFPLDFLYSCGILAQIIGGIAAEIGRYFVV